MDSKLGAAAEPRRHGTSLTGQTGWIVVERGRYVCVRIIPRQPGRRLRLHLFGVVRLGQRISEGVDPIEPAGVDEAHEQVASLAAKERLVVQWTLA